MPPGAAAGCQVACNFRAFRAALTAYIIAHAHSGLQHLDIVVGALSRMLSRRAGRRALTPSNLPRGRGRHAAPDESGCAGLGPVHRGEDRVIRRGQACCCGRRSSPEHAGWRDRLVCKEPLDVRNDWANLWRAVVPAGAVECARPHAARNRGQLAHCGPTRGSVAGLKPCSKGTKSCGSARLTSASMLSNALVVSKTLHLSR